jgi:hypothetical protein
MHRHRRIYVELGLLGVSQVAGGERLGAGFASARFDSVA